MVRSVVCEARGPGFDSSSDQGQTRKMDISSASMSVLRFQTSLVSLFLLKNFYGSFKNGTETLSSNFVSTENESFS